jgi:hypothetical protein
MRSYKTRPFGMPTARARQNDCYENEYATIEGLVFLQYKTAYKNKTVNGCRRQRLEVSLKPFVN